MRRGEKIERSWRAWKVGREVKDIKHRSTVYLAIGTQQKYLTSCPKVGKIYNQQYELSLTISEFRNQM